MQDSEALELLKQGYRKFWVLHLHCPGHGYWRCAIPYAPENGHYPCPVCNQSCASGVLPSINFTQGELPRPALLVGRIDWPALDRELAPEPEPVPVIDDDHYIGANGRIRRLGPKVGAAGTRIVAQGA